MIPKVIHYCWFGGKPLPKEVKKCIASWRRMCPDYEIKQWDESNFDVQGHPFVQSAYDAKAWAFVSDYARLKVVYDCGGIYLDTDVELLKNLDSLREYQCYIGMQQAECLCTTGLGFGATKSNPVVQEMLKKYDDIIYSDEKKDKIACPWLNNEVIVSHGYRYSEEVEEVDGILVLPCRYLDPVAPGGRVLQCEDTISIHHYSASWMGSKTIMKRKLIHIIGQDNAIRIKQFIKRK